MRHRYECPLRWADMDMLGHVNNVTYVDYLQEARIAMLGMQSSFRGGEELAEGVVVARHDLDFLTPLVFRRTPVVIDSWVSQIRAASFTIDYEILTEPGTVVPAGPIRPEDLTERGGSAKTAQRVVHVQASTQLVPYRFGREMPRRIVASEREMLERFSEPAPVRHQSAAVGYGPDRHTHELQVRWSDVDAYRHVNNVAYLEFIQEARIRYLMDLQERTDGGWTRHVVARTDIGYRRPMSFRLRPYAVHSRVGHVGSRSFTISSDVRDGTDVLAHSDVVMVGYDPDAGGSRPLTASQRAILLTECSS